MATTGTKQAEDSLPHDYDTERYVLGAILVSNTYLDSAAQDLTSLDFFHSDHQVIFRAMAELHEDQRGIDEVTLADHLATKRQTVLAGLPAIAYLSSLQDGIPQISNVAQYVQIIKKKSHIRRIIKLAYSVECAGFEADADPAKLEQLLRDPPASYGMLAAANGNGNGNGHVDFKSYSFTDFMAATFPPKDHLIEAVTPKMGRVMIIAMPHRLKSWGTIGLALHGSRAGTALGMLKVDRPVRTYVAQLEDWPGMLQDRFNELILKPQFSDAEVRNLHILPRCALDLTIDSHFAWLLRDLKEFKPDHVVLDVLRKFFGGDVNSPKETAVFLKRLDYLQDEIGCALTLVHHENRKKEDIMLAAAGSYNLAGWAEVLILFSRKIEAKTDTGTITSVEIEIDTKVGPPVESMRLVLDTSSPRPLRLEPLEDGTGFHDSMKQLSPEGWNVDHLATVLGVARSNAWKRLEKWEKSGKVEKIKSGKRGRNGGLATWRSLDPIDSL